MAKKTEIEYTAPVKGAAEYKATGNNVWMIDTDGFESVIEVRATPAAAITAANKWQKMENKSVLKSQK